MLACLALSAKTFGEPLRRTRHRGPGADCQFRRYFIRHHL